MNSNTVLLDLDGTLTDPGVGIFRCIAFALRELRLPVPAKDRLRAWVGPPLLDSFARYFESLNTGVDADLALELYRRRFVETGMFENEVYPGVHGLLEELNAQGLRLLVATSKPEIFAARIVAHFGLDRWLHGVHGSELDGARVDKVDLLQHIIVRERLEADRCIMVGDREHDILAARYHGMIAIGVRWGYGSERELLEAGAHHLVTDPQQLMVSLNIAPA